MQEFLLTEGAARFKIRPYGMVQVCNNRNDGLIESSIEIVPYSGDGQDALGAN